MCQGLFIPKTFLLSLFQIINTLEIKEYGKLKLFYFKIDILLVHLPVSKNKEDLMKNDCKVVHYLVL